MLELISDIEYLFKDRNFEKVQIPPITLYAVGGFPITIRNEIPYLFGKIFDKKFLTSEINKGLGLSGMMTYSNKSNFSLEQMGKKCKELDHLWGYNFITLSFLFVNTSRAVEVAFLRNTTFYESWSCVDDNIYGMTGSIKDFKKFVSHKDDKSFDLDTRMAMEYIDKNYSFLWL